MSRRASQAVAAAPSSLWPGGIIQAQGLIWLFLATWRALPLLKLVAKGVVLAVLDRYWLSLTEFFIAIASLLMRARHILGLVILTLSSVDCARNLLEVAFFALFPHNLLFLSPGYGASHQIRTRGKLTLDLSNFLYFKRPIFDILLYPLHLG